MPALLHNKKATFNYEILDTFTAGIKLLGYEVKALTTHKGGSLTGSYITTRGNDLWIKGMRIPPYQVNNMSASYDPLHARKLLVKKKEAVSIINQLTTAGLTIVPLSVYLHSTSPRAKSSGRIVLECAVVRGKKVHDKRQSIRKREDERTIRRTLKVR
jgi:SsrA-binding protein